MKFCMTKKTTQKKDKQREGQKWILRESYTKGQAGKGRGIGLYTEGAVCPKVQRQEISRPFRR